jgi:hypothetical protein
MPSTDPFAKVQPRQRLQIPAQAYNAFIDAAKAFKSGQFAAGAAAPAAGAGDLGIVPIQNNTGNALDRFSVLGVSNALILPTENLPIFQSQRTLVGVTPTTASHAGKFVILLQPLADQAVGAALASGVCAVQLSVGSSSDTFADVLDGDASKLKSGASGAAQILWMEGSGATRWAVVRVGAPGGAFQPLCGKLKTAWNPGDATVTLTPCVGFSNNTATGAADVTCSIKFPVGASPPAFAGNVGDVLAYVTFTDPGAGATINMLFQPPLWPVPTHIDEVIANAAATGSAPHYVAKYISVHA